MAEKIRIDSHSALAAKSPDPVLVSESFPLYLRGGSDSEDSGYETEDPNDAAGYDGDDELEDEELDYESDYSYMDSDDSGDSWD
jgi:hypothetical protein